MHMGQPVHCVQHWDNHILPDGNSRACSVMQSVKPLPATANPTARARSGIVGIRRPEWLRKFSEIYLATASFASALRLAKTALYDCQ